MSRAVRFGVPVQNGRTPCLSLLDLAGREILRFHAPTWNLHQIETLCDHAGVSVNGSYDTYDDSVGAFVTSSAITRSLRRRRQILTRVGLIAWLVQFAIFVVAILTPTQ
jgi:hypothetical protein